MTVDECRRKRNELLATARDCPDEAIAWRCRNMAASLLIAMVDHEGGLAQYDMQRRDFEHYVNKTAHHAPELPDMDVQATLAAIRRAPERTA